VTQASQSGSGTIRATFYLVNKSNQTVRVPGKIILDQTGVSFRSARKGRAVIDIEWSNVERISFDDPGRTRANIAALAMFGALAIGSRRTFSLLTISTVSGQSYYCETRDALGTWRSVAPQICNAVPQVRGKLTVDGDLVGVPAVPAQAAAVDDIPAQIRSLGELRDQGLLTSEEFETKKAELLARM
jgi:hypothetical protein